MTRSSSTFQFAWGSSVTNRAFVLEEAELIGDRERRHVGELDEAEGEFVDFEVERLAPGTGRPQGERQHNAGRDRPRTCDQGKPSMENVHFACSFAAAGGNRKRQDAPCPKVARRASQRIWQGGDARFARRRASAVRPLFVKRMPIPGSRR
jgi:hypothetical protein